MMPVSTAGGGITISFPDVCKTPVPVVGVVPIPYPNIATIAGSKQKSKTMISKMSVLTTKSKVGRSSGDEAGVAGGVISSKMMAEVQFLKSSLVTITSKLQNLKSKDPLAWQSLLEEYAVTTSALYVTLHGDD